MQNYRMLNGTINYIDGSKERIIEKWMSDNQITTLFAKYEIGKEYFSKNIASHLFDIVVENIKTGSKTTDYDGLNRLITFVNAKMIKFHELIPLKDSFFWALTDTMYGDGMLSKKVFDELYIIFIGIYKEASEYILSKSIDFQAVYEAEGQKNFRLLNEYKKAVDEGNIVSKTNPKGIITYVNKQFCMISGYREEELIGKSHNIVRHPDMPRSAFKDMWETIKEKKTWKGTVKNLKKDGGTYIVDTTIVPITDVDGDIVEFIGIRHDITEFETAKEQLRTLNFAMKKKVNELYGMTQNLEQQATTDTLTGIYNRYKFNELCDIEVKKSKTNGSALSLIIFDIDKFKEINDTYGHQAGDKALIDVVHIVSHNIVSGSIFARWGGEEFVILLPSQSTVAAVETAERLRIEIERNCFEEIGSITVSFGVSEFESIDEGEDLLKKADEALYLAKRNGRNRVEVFI